MGHLSAGPIRRPAVAGYFYPADPLALMEEIDRFVGDGGQGTGPIAATGIVVPHGSFQQCGVVLGRTFRHLAIPRRCVIIGPSHTGRAPGWSPHLSSAPTGRPSPSAKRQVGGWSLMAQGAYRTPLGDVPIDAAGAAMLRASCEFLEPDPSWQRGEHAIEVPLVFLQRLGPPDLAIVPIVADAGDRAQWEQLAATLSRMALEEPSLLIASSDLSQYAPQGIVQRQDVRLLGAIHTLDGARLLRVVEEGSLAMCGASAVACVLEAAHACGAREATVAHYATSADAGGDPGSAIGYAGVIVY